MGIPVSQRPGRAEEAEAEAEVQATELSAEERRQGTRKTLIGGRLVTVRLGSDASGLALDLSDSGIGLRAFPDLSVGHTISLLFEVPGIQSRVETTARVEWVERSASLWKKGSGGRAGLRFLDLSDSTRSLITQWIAEDLPQLQAVPKTTQPANAAGQAVPQGSVLGDLRGELQQNHLSGLPALQWIAKRALQDSGADGAAIALDDGQGMVCRAASGNAPDLGARINSNSGLSGECVRTGQIVHCEDTENDQRVDPALCRDLNLRCALIFPLYRSRRLCGVLEVFAAEPYAFSSQTVSFLQQVSDLIVEVSAGMLPELGRNAESFRLDAAELMRRGTVGQASPASPAQASLQTVRESEPATVSAPAASVSAEARRVVKTAALSETIACDVCGYLNPRGQRICSKCDVPLGVVENFLGTPNGEQEREAQAAALLARSRYGVGEPLPVPAFPQSRGEKERKRKPLIAAGVLLVLVSLAIGMWKGFESEPVPTSAAEVAATASSAPDPVETTPVPATTPTDVNTGNLAKPVKPAKPAAQTAIASKSVAAVAKRPLEDATSVRWIINRGTTARSAAAPVEPASLPAPTGQLPALPYIVVVPQAQNLARTPDRVSEGITGGELIRKVNPLYPAAARNMGKKGSVVLAGIVDRSGVLQNLRAVEGDPVLVAAALTAARNWRYEPYRLNGDPIEIETKIVFHFR